jgi:two-component system, OmpR family, sensor kinase
MRSRLGGLTIRTRITAGTLAIGLVVSAVAGILLLVDVSSIVHDSTVQLLHNDLSPLESAIKRAPTDPDIRAGEGQLAALINPSGRVVVSNLPDSLEDQITELRQLHGAPKQVGSEGNGYLVKTASIVTSHGTWKVIVARSLQPGNLVLHQLGATMVIGALVLFACLGIASWLLSGAALRPVSRMRREAERLGTEDITATLPVGQAPDELAALAATLNDFLDRQRQSIEHERQMVSDASHELRTPLAVLVAQLDEAAGLDGDRRAQLRAIDNASRTAARLARLTTNLLELSKLDAHQAVSSRSSWSELVQELSLSIDRSRMVAHPRSVDVDFEVADSDGSDQFGVSPSNFGRLVDNLLANSIAASEPDGAVTASLENDASTVRLVVRDEGPGVPEDFIPVAFDRFSRPDEARPTRDGGSGLGLAIVAAIVTQAHGTIVMQNLNPGLSVSVALPACRRQA